MKQATETTRTLVEAGFKEYHSGVYWHDTGLIGILYAEDTERYNLVALNGKTLYVSHDMIDTLWFAIDLLAGAPVPSYRQIRDMIKRQGRTKTQKDILGKIMEYLQI